MRTNGLDVCTALHFVTHGAADVVTKLDQPLDNCAHKKERWRMGARDMSRQGERAGTQRVHALCQEEAASNVRTRAGRTVRCDEAVGTSDRVRRHVVGADGFPGRVAGCPVDFRKGLPAP